MKHASVVLTPVIFLIAAAAMLAANTTVQYNSEGIRLYVSGRYREAEESYRRAIAEQEKTTSPTGVELAPLLSNLGASLHQQGRIDESRQVLERALRIYQQAGSKDSRLGLALNHLAMLDRRDMKYENAIVKLTQALEIQVNTFGRNHSEVAATLHNLGSVYYDLGQRSKARTHFTECVEIMERVRGPVSAELAGSLSYMARLESDDGKVKESEAMQQRAVQIRTLVLGLAHPQLATSMADLGELYMLHGKYAEAEEIYRKAIAVLERAGGARHPSMATTLLRLAEVYRRSKRWEDAIPAFEQAISLLEEMHSPEHPSLALVLPPYAEVLKKAKRKHEAEQIGSRAKAIHDKNGPIDYRSHTIDASDLLPRR